MDSAGTGQLGLIAVIAVALVVFLYLSVRIVRQYERMVVFRLGHTSREMVREPGLRFLVLFVDRPVMVDMRERFVEVPTQTVITSDAAPVDIAFLIYYRVVDPLASVVNVSDLDGALRGVAAPTLRSTVAELPVDELIGRREAVDEALRARLEEQAANWGATVTEVEIREILPPPEVQAAMVSQVERRTLPHRLAELGEARDSGLITEAEFEARRRAILEEH